MVHYNDYEGATVGRAAESGIIIYIPARRRRIRLSGIGSAYPIKMPTLPTLQEEAAQALAHMCMSAEGLDSVVTQGGIPPLVKLLRSG